MNCSRSRRTACCNYGSAQLSMQTLLENAYGNFRTAQMVVHTFLANRLCNYVIVDGTKDITLSLGHFRL